MPKFVNITSRSLRHNVVRVPIVFALIVASVVSLWFATARQAEAATVPICHKRTETIMVVFGSLDYRRHKDHGDTDGACASTTMSAFLSPKRGPVARNEAGKK